MGLNAKLVVVGGDIKTTEIDLKLPAIIGRGRGAAILLPHPLVSRQHCELFENDGCLMVRDLGSLNGTYIGQDKIGEGPLPPGSLLTVGAVTFRAVYDGENAAVENNGGHASDTAVGLPSSSFGEETVPTDDVIVVATPPKTAPALIIPTTAAPAKVAKPVSVPAPTAKPVAPAATPAKPAVGPPAAAIGPVAPPEEEVEEKAEAAEAEEDFQSFLKSLDGK